LIIDRSSCRSSIKLSNADDREAVVRYLRVRQISLDVQVRNGKKILMNKIEAFATGQPSVAVLYNGIASLNPECVLTQRYIYNSELHGSDVGLFSKSPKDA
jgi:hypothetical protein